jgi:hypothetical protein
MDEEYGANGRIDEWKGNRSTRRKPALVSLGPPRIPHDPPA